VEDIVEYTNFMGRSRDAGASESDFRTSSEVHAGQLSAYAALLSEPIAGLAGNVSDRSDVRTVAILGYN
jgi:hypothetical protein